MTVTSRRARWSVGFGVGYVRGFPAMSIFQGPLLGRLVTVLS